MTSKVDTFLRRVAEAPDKTPPKVPTRLAHFVVDSKLGAGGMGIVYLALDERLDRRVALKVLQGDIVEDATSRERFLREARLAAAITHPNVATVYEVGESDGWIYIAMELVGGRSLREALAERALSVDDALRIGRAIASALARAHAQHIVHRDLKPDNVMLTPEGDVKVLDFGLARRAAPTPTELSSRVTTSGQIMGTPAYMSPEQCTGKEVDARSDVFSFGVLLYELLTREAPFHGESVVELFAAITRDTPPPASKANASVPPEVDRVLAKCLAKAPADRYATAAALLDDLTRASAAPSKRGVLLVAGVALVVGASAVAWSLRPHGAPRRALEEPVTSYAQTPTSTPTPMELPRVESVASTLVAPSASAPPHRRMYGGATGACSGNDFSKCDGCDSQPYVDLVRAQKPAIDRCFRAAQFDAPNHELVEYDVDVDATGAFVLFRPRSPLPRTLDACLRSVLSSARLSKPSGGPGSFGIWFTAECVSGWAGHCQ